MAQQLGAGSSGQLSGAQDQYREAVKKKLAEVRRGYRALLQLARWRSRLERGRCMAAGQHAVQSCKLPAPTAPAACPAARGGAAAGAGGQSEAVQRRQAGM